MSRNPVPLLLAGLFATTVLAVGSDWAHGPQMIARLQAEADAALAATGAPGVRAQFRTSNGWLTRHPRLIGGERLDPLRRAAAARAVAAVPGVGGVQWASAALSLERARGVREALIQRGIDRSGLRARGLGSSQPIAALDPADPANRRIEFSLISPTPQPATPLDPPDGG